MNKNHYLSRAYLVTAFFAILILLLLAYLYYLQVIKHPGFYKKAQNQHYFSFERESARGMIFDCRGKPLAISIAVDSIYAMPPKIGDADFTAKKLKGLIKKEAPWIKKQLNKKCSFVWLARKLDLESSRALQGLNLDGIGSLKEYRRFYPQGNLAAHLLGFAGLDNQGLEGLERYYDDRLFSFPRKCIVRRDALGKRIILGEEEAFVTKPFSLLLTIDATIQHIAEKELNRVFNETKAKGAQLVIMRPRTGEILALANRPTFNPNQFGKYLPEEWRNRVVTDIYEPGSLFKVISAAAALENDLVVPQDKFFCENGSFKFYDRIIHDHEGEGWLSFREVIEKSSNIGITKVSLLLGKEKLYKQIQQFGFGRCTGVDIPGEVKGILHPVKKWTKSSLGAIPYGHEISATSIQLLLAISTVANGGLMMRPYVVKEIRDKKQKLTRKFHPQIKKRVISSRTARILTEILEGVVTSGTGRFAQVSGYRVAGKTGTAQKFESSMGRYSQDKSVVSFIGFAPAENPAIAVLVMVDEPEGKAWGGTVAAPVFSRVVGKTLSYLQISPRWQKQENLKPSRAEKKMKEKIPAASSKGIMPDLKGETIRESLASLSAFNLDVKIRGSGFLCVQRPLPKAKINVSERCFLEFRPR